MSHAESEHDGTWSSSWCLYFLFLFQSPELCPMRLSFLVSLALQCCETLRCFGVLRSEILADGSAGGGGWWGGGVGIGGLFCPAPPAPVRSVRALLTPTPRWVGSPVPGHILFCSSISSLFLIQNSTVVGVGWGGCQWGGGQGKIIRHRLPLESGSRAVLLNSGKMVVWGQRSHSGVRGRWICIY